MRSQFLEIPWGNWLLQLNIPQWGREFLIWNLKWMQKNKNEEPVPENSLGELAPPTNAICNSWLKKETEYLLQDEACGLITES